MSDRVYVPLASVSAACGVRLYHLLTRYWPEGWSVPRDWRMLPRSSTVLVAEASLPQLVASLCEAGQMEAAGRLEQWCAEIESAESHEEFVARHTPPSAVRNQPWWKKGQFA